MRFIKHLFHLGSFAFLLALFPLFFLGFATHFLSEDALPLASAFVGSASVVVAVLIVVYSADAQYIRPLEWLQKSLNAQRGDKVLKPKWTKIRLQANMSLASVLNVLESYIEELFRAKEEAEQRQSAVQERYEQSLQGLLRLLQRTITPLQMAQGYAQGLTKLQMSSAVSVHGMAESIVRLVRQVQTNLDMVGDVAKVHGDALELRTEPFDIHHMLRQLTGHFQVRLQEQKVRIVVEIDDSCPRSVLGDEDRVEQVLHILIGQSLRFTRDGFVLIRASCEDHERDGLMLSLTIDDQGLKMTAGDYSELFKPIWDADKQLYRAGGGSFELALARLLVEKMGGRLDASSSVEGGNRFTAQLRLQLDTEIGAGKSVDVQSALRVLLVDDNPLVSKTAARMLEGLGYEVVQAVGGVDALDYVDANRVDVIITDIYMPVMNGFELAKSLRATGCTQPIIGMSAANREECLQQCLSSGMDDFIAKPLRLDIIAQVLRLALAQVRHTPL